MKRRVAILGGGVAGLTVAHELVLRGFEVDIYEKREGTFALGGKARSQRVRLPSGAELDGEHGYRFFPAFYRAVPDTLRRIPWDPAASTRPADPGVPFAHSIADALVPAELMGIARRGERIAIFRRDVPGGLEDLASMVRGLVRIFRGIPLRDLFFIVAKLLHYWTRGSEERLEVHENQRFWDFMRGPSLDPATQLVLEYTPKSLVAMRATEGNTRTLLNAFLLMMRDFACPQPSDFVLAGPTSRTWIERWRDWLTRLGVRFHLGVEVSAIDVRDGIVRAAQARRASGAPIEICADEFVLATPIEVARSIAARSLAVGEACEELELIRDFPVEQAVGWMVGAQLFLARDVPIVRGHMAFGDSAWAVSAISQRQFWSAGERAVLDAAGVGGVISVIATEWDAGRDGRPRGRECTREEARDQLLAQIRECHDEEGRPLLDGADVVHFHLDEEVAFSGTPARPAANGAPLLVHPPGLWKRRPDAWCHRVPNLYFAADWVRNPMDLATMEGASAAARIAVNKLLARTEAPAAACCPVVDDYQAANDPIFLQAIQQANDLRYLAKIDAPTVDTILALESGSEMTSEQDVEERLIRLAPVIAGTSSPA